MKHTMRNTLLVLLGISAVLLSAATFDKGGHFARAKITVTNALVLDSSATATLPGTTTLTGTFIQGAAKVLTNTDVSLTSPSVSPSVTSAGELVTLTSDANQTGIIPTGGTLRRVIEFTSGAGSNTMRFDDGTSMTIGANITLTEAQQDSLTLRCTSSDGDEWTAVAAHDN